MICILDLRRMEREGVDVVAVAVALEVEVVATKEVDDKDEVERAAAAVLYLRDSITGDFPLRRGCRDCCCGCCFLSSSGALGD